jgi:hypothetical protein
MTTTASTAVPVLAVIVLSACTYAARQAPPSDGGGGAVGDAAPSFTPYSPNVPAPSMPGTTSDASVAGITSDASVAATTSDASVAATTIGTSGGTVSLNGVTLTIPVDALTADTAITVATMTAPAGYAVASAAYQFGPAGTMFAHAVSVTLPLTMSAPRAHLFWSNASGGFDDLGGVVSGTILMGQVTYCGIGFAATP